MPTVFGAVWRSGLSLTITQPHPFAKPPRPIVGRTREDVSPPEVGPSTEDCASGVCG